MAKHGGHFTLNAPPYKPPSGAPVFYGVPDVNGAILTDEAQQAFNVIRNFGAGGSSQQAYVEAFFNGEAGNPPEPMVRQIADIDEHFSLSTTQEKAVNHGTAATRAEFLTGMTIAGGLDANNQPVASCGACQSTTITVAKVGSEYAGICARFQKNLGAGGHG